MSVLRLLDRESITVPPQTTVADAIQHQLHTLEQYVISEEPGATKARG